MEYNKNITFNCTVTSLTTPNITWTTTTTAGITSDVLTSSQGSNMYTSSLVLNGVTLESIGSYTCTATNEGGTTTATAMLNVTGKIFCLPCTYVYVHQCCSLIAISLLFFLSLSHSQYLLHQYQYLMIVSI